MIEVVPGSAGVLRFVAERVGVKPHDMEPAESIGVERDGELVAGLVYNNYAKLPKGDTITVSIASDCPRALTRGVIRAAFEYPLVQLGVKRLQALVSVENERCLRFVRRLGFQQEGVMRRAWDGEVDAVLWSMMPEEAERWLGFQQR